MADCLNCIHQEVCKERMAIFNCPNIACQYEAHELTGEWLSHYEYCKKHDCIPSGLIAFWWCNQCEQGVEIPTNFCPNCGASMRKEGGEK